MKKIRVEHSSGFAKKYDVFFAAAGHEGRCSYIAEKIQRSARNRHVWIYSDDLSARAKESRLRFGALNFTSHESSTSDPRAVIQALLSTRSERANEPLSICVDISCLTRELMAIWIFEAMQHEQTGAVKMEFAYTHAKFSPPPASMGLAKTPSAIIPEFSGYFSNPSNPILLILGLGYEPHLALGFLEYLDPDKVVVFEPARHDRRYSTAIAEENGTFLNIVRSSPRLRYDVYRPSILFQDIESVIQGALSKYRVCIAPYGLKLFVIGSLLGSAIHYPEVLVWHLKPDGNSRLDLPDRVASGRTSVLRAIFE